MQSILGLKRLISEALGIALMVAILVALKPAFAISKAQAGGNPLLGVNIEQPGWYTAPVFVDAIKTARPFTAADDPYGAFIATDPEGWVASRISS